jgi:hypothetical protein
MGDGIVKVVLDRVYGPRKNNVRTATRLTTIAINMGLAKSGDDQDE